MKRDCPLLPGPTGKGLFADGQASRSAHIAGGLVRAEVPGVDNVYSIEFWFWNGMPNDARDITGYLFSRSPGEGTTTAATTPASAEEKPGAGRLFFSNGNSASQKLVGQTTIEPKHLESRNNSAGSRQCARLPERRGGGWICR